MNDFYVIEYIFSKISILIEIENLFKYHYITYHIHFVNFIINPDVALLIRRSSAVKNSFIINQ